MKKYIASIIIGVLMCLLAGCGSTKETRIVNPDTPAGIVYNDFVSEMDSDDRESAEELAQELCENRIFPFRMVVSSVLPGPLKGFTEDVNGFTEGAMFEPKMGNIPFVAYVFTVEGDVEAFSEGLKQKADIRWNVHAQADEMVSVAIADKVLFLMAPENFS